MKRGLVAFQMIVGSALLMLGSWAGAQTGPRPGFGRGPQDGIGFLGFEGTFGGKVVAGAPYSAQIATEHTQTLPDGNQIDRKTTASVARDSQGRTYRQASLPAIGAFAASGTPPQAIFITDPVAGFSYVLDPGKKTAHKSALPPPRTGGNNGPQFQRGSNNETSASLGTQTVNGVLVQGTQITRTIPAGSRLGNAQPISVVSTRWYSTQLSIDIQTQTTDPQNGKTTMNVTDLSQSEPDPTLFQVPAGYTIVAGGPGGPRGRRPDGSGTANP